MTGGVLSDRQQLILRRRAQGDRGPEIARHLHIAISTVDWHERVIVHTYRARNIVHAVALAAQAGHLADPADSPLTDRQHEALLWTARGSTARETAARMGAPVDTVNWLLGQAYRRLGATNAPHAVALAMAAGLITAADITPTEQEHAA